MAIFTFSPVIRHTGDRMTHSAATAENTGYRSFMIKILYKIGFKPDAQPAPRH